MKKYITFDSVAYSLALLTFVLVATMLCSACMQMHERTHQKAVNIFDELEKPLWSRPTSKKLLNQMAFASLQKTFSWKVCEKTALTLCMMRTLSIRYWKSAWKKCLTQTTETNTLNNYDKLDKTTAWNSNACFTALLEPVALQHLDVAGAHHG